MTTKDIAILEYIEKRQKEILKNQPKKHCGKARIGELNNLKYQINNNCLSVNKVNLSQIKNLVHFVNAIVVSDIEKGFDDIVHNFNITISRYGIEEYNKQIDMMNKIKNQINLQISKNLEEKLYKALCKV